MAASIDPNNPKPQVMKMLFPGLDIKDTPTPRRKRESKVEHPDDPLHLPGADAPREHQTPEIAAKIDELSKATAHLDRPRGNGQTTSPDPGAKMRDTNFVDDPIERIENYLAQLKQKQAEEMAKVAEEVAVKRREIEDLEMMREEVASKYANMIKGMELALHIAQGGSM